LAEGSLLADLYNLTMSSFGDESPLSWNKFTDAASKLSERFKTLTTLDVATILGIERSFTEREFKIIKSILKGQAFKHHREYEYFAGMGRASGFLVQAGQEIRDLESNDV